MRIFSVPKGGIMMDKKVLIDFINGEISLKENK